MPPPVWLLLPALLAAQDPAPAPVKGGAARLAAWEQRRAMAEASPFAALEWRALGPWFCGGRIEAVDAPPDSAGTLYAGVGAGGVWKSTNGGLAWEAIFDDQPTMAIGDVAVSPARAELVWVGTGEAHLSGTSYEGVGVFKSIDGGASWRHVGLVDSAHIGKVVPHPTDPERAWVAAMGPRHDPEGERGVYRTTDGGATWERVLFPGPRVALVDLVVDPNDPARLWAAAWSRGGAEPGGVFRTTDGGDSWERLGGGLLEGAVVGRVAVDASASAPGVVYALVVDHSPEGGGRRGVGGLLFRSDDGGDTWRRTHEGYLPTYVGWDFCDVRVAPDDADRVYVCGMRLIVSQDGGATFESAGEDVQRLLPHAGVGMHLDVHDLWIDPTRPERVLLGNDGGLYASWDRARSWLHLNNLPIAEFYRVHVDGAEPFGIWGGTQDNASLVLSSGATAVPGREDPWEHVFLDPWSGGDGFSTFPDPYDRTLVYYAQQLGDLKRARRGGLRRARRITPPGDGLDFAWDTPYLASAHAEGVLYCAAQRVFRSADRGERWTAIGPEPRGGAILALSESPLDAARLVTGAGDGHVQRTSDGGATWSVAGAGLPAERIRDVLASRHDPERVYVALSGARDGDWRAYLYRSDDFGATWRNLGEGLPAEPVNAVIEDAADPDVLYVGTDLGVFASTDGGATWAVLGTGLPTAAVVDLALHAGSSTLVAVTHGLSAFALDVGAVASE